MVDKSTINITFPNGVVKKNEKGITGIEIAQGISPRLAREVLSISVGDELWDLMRPIQKDTYVKLHKWEEEEGRHAFWHSSAHLMAEAVEALYPGVKFGIGPAIENGFYYDIDFMHYPPLSENDLSGIEHKMKELINQKNGYVRQEISKKDAFIYFNKKHDEYKLELIEELEDGSITFYKQGKFIDLCRGPHIPNTSYIKAFKITALAGAYWRGNENNKQLTRLYGISFPKQKMLNDYLILLEEAKKRDHRKLGKEMELFTFSSSVGQGLPLWLPKGAELRKRLEGFLIKIQKDFGYKQVITPHIGSTTLYKTSGHYDKYGEDSYQPIKTPNRGEEYILKPMNCPHHCEIYKSKPHSYRDLPIRLAEFGTVYRYEQSGELHGLTRVRGFTQDDAHIFCTTYQLKEEFNKVIDIILLIFKALDFKDYAIQISLKDKSTPEKYIGSPENWENAENAIIEIAEERNLKSKIVEGEAAFYGPKMDFMVKDALGRKWQLGTIQVDYNLPEKFDLTYIDADNNRVRPIMIHRAPFGSMERFIALLLEHTAGKFPLWLVPEQVVVIPISEKFNTFAVEISKLLNNNKIYTFVDTRNERTGKKIRDNELKKIPYLLVVGQKEKQNGTVSVRKQGMKKQLGEMKIDAFIEIFKSELNKVTQI